MIYKYFFKLNFVGPNIDAKAGAVDIPKKEDTKFGFAKKAIIQDTLLHGDGSTFRICNQEYKIVRIPTKPTHFASFKVKSSELVITEAKNNIIREQYARTPVCRPPTP